MISGILKIASLTWRTVWLFIDDLRNAAARWSEDDGNAMAAATAYYVGLSFFPLLLVLIAGVGWFIQHTQLGEDSQQVILKAINENMSPQLGDYVKQSLELVQDRSSIGGPIGLATMLVASLAAFGQLDSAFNRIWRLPASESTSMLRYLLGLLVQRGRAFLALLGLGAVVVIVFIAGLVLAAIQSHTATVLPLEPWVWNAMQIAITFVTNALVFTLLYRLLPKAPVRWKPAIEGGLLTAVAWEFGRQLITIVVARSKFSAYGVVGAFLAILLWCYYSVAIVLLGAEYIQVLRARARAERRKKAHEGS
jgi:membrane protein